MSTDFEASIENLSQKCKECFQRMPLSEEETKNVLVSLMLIALDFDTTNLDQVRSEDKAGERDGHDTQTDYDLFSSDPEKPVAIVEVKRLGEDLKKHFMQLKGYFQATKAKHTHIAILTDGNRYMFYTDSIDENLMDSKPYWQFSLLDITDKQIKELALYSRGSIDSTVANLQGHIEELKIDRFAKDLKEDLKCGKIPDWLADATVNELQTEKLLNSKRLTPNIKQKLHPAIENIWKEIGGLGAKRPVEIKGNLPTRAQTANREGLISLPSLINSGRLTHLEVKGYQLGNDPYVPVKNSMADCAFRCISDLERENGLVERFGSELEFFSKDKLPYHCRCIKGWWVNLCCNTERHCKHLAKCFQKLGRDPEELKFNIFYKEQNQRIRK